MRWFFLILFLITVMVAVATGPRGRKFSDPRFDFQRFYDALSARGYVIYPGKLTVADSFRIGCIGRIGATEINGALSAVREVLTEMGVTHCGRRSVA